MPCSIVVTVCGSHIRRYERYVCTLQMDEVRTMRYDWKEIMDRCARDQIEVSEPPRLVYEMTRGQLFLVWEVTGQDQTVRYLAL